MTCFVDCISSWYFWGTRLREVQELTLRHTARVGTGFRIQLSGSKALASFTVFSVSKHPLCSCSLACGKIRIRTWWNFLLVGFFFFEKIEILF